MITFIATVTIIFTSITGAFEQGQANPEANGFFDSKSTVVEQEAFIVDTI